MNVQLPVQEFPVKIVFDSEARMDDEQYYAFCMANPDVRLERTSSGEIVIVPPAGFESDHHSVDVGAQLHSWAERDGRGRASGMSAEFILPTGAALPPDAAWTSNQKLSKLTREELRGFPRLAPEFVIEVMSPSDRLRAAKEKMQEWMRGGVELGWLIDADRKTVYVYRPGQGEPEACIGPETLTGEGAVAGFTLDLREIWRGL